MVKYPNIQNFFILLMMLGALSCNGPQQNRQQDADEKVQQTNALQPKRMLLDEVTRAVCYSGFRSGQHPDRGDGAVNPTYDQILEDLLILRDQTPFRLIRLYDCGENSRMTLRVIRENELDFSVMLGMWLKAELSAHETCEWLTEPIPQETLDNNKKQNSREITEGIRLANEYREIIVAVNVGNETQVDWNDHKVPTDTLIRYVQQVKKAIDQPVTVADNYRWWADHGRSLAAAVDFVSVHTYPVWEGKDIAEGLPYTIQNIKDVMNALPESQIVISEAGWPSVASEFGDRATPQKQEQYIDELLNWAVENHITTFIFEAFDEDWKGDPGNPLGAEKHWGLFTVDRQPKEVTGLFSKQNASSTSRP